MDKVAGISYRRVGNGEPLVLIHGTGGSGGIWDPVVDLVKHEREVLAIDLPGCGASDPLTPGLPVTNRMLADRVETFLAELGVTRPHIAGTSLGGQVALLLGARSLARSVVAFSPTGFYTGGESRYLRTLVTGLRLSAKMSMPMVPTLAKSAMGRKVLLGTSFANPAAVPPKAAVETVTCLVRSSSLPGMMRHANREIPGGAWAGTPQAAASPRKDVADGLAEVPLTIAWAAKDKFLPVKQAQRARQAFPHARHEVLADTGHLATWDNPTRLAELLLESESHPV